MAAGAERSETTSSGPSSLGPDPVWGVGLFVVGLLAMGVGGAMTWHSVFNVGEGLLLLGAAVFLLFVAVSSQKQNPIRLRAVLRRALGRDEEPDGANEGTALPAGDEPPDAVAAEADADADRA